MSVARTLYLSTEGKFYEGVVLPFEILRTCRVILNYSFL